MEKKNLVAVTLKVEPDVRERLEKLAEADRRTLSNYLRLVLLEHVNQPRPQGKAA